MNNCEYCNQPFEICLKHFEASLYEIEPLRHLDDKTFSNINDAIKWAEGKSSTYIRSSEDYFTKLFTLDVYQGCDRENIIYQQEI